MDWNYTPEESSTPIPEGRYQVCIEDVEKTQSKAGNDMLKIKLIVGGTNNRRIWNHIVFLPDRPEITNRMLTQFFDAFGIDRGNFNLSEYVGKIGGCQIKHDESGRAQVHYFLTRSAMEKLAPYDGEFVPSAAEAQQEDDLPF